MNEYEAAAGEPSWQKRMEAFAAEDGRFVYYTSAKAGLQILKDRAIWMRAAACMNDYREIRYGIELFNHMFYRNEDCRERLERLAGALGWGDHLLESLLLRLNGTQGELVRRVFLTCVSEQNRTESTDSGRLSMWRAYGRKTGLAFVLRGRELLRGKQELPLTIRPVEYLSQADFDQMIAGRLQEIEAHMGDFQREASGRLLRDFIDSVLESVMFIKHPGFAEEQEWRIVYREDAEGLEHSLVSIDGVPQIIYKLPLKLRAAAGPGLVLEDLFEQLIIGPTEYADVIADAFALALRELGIADAAARVQKSNIPLR